MVSPSPGSPRRANNGPDWLDLPTDVTLTILKKVTPADLLERTQMVCRTWRNISKDPSLWRSIDSSRFEGSSTRKEKMMMRAVDLSSGQLVDAQIEGHEILQYVAYRASQLMRLEIYNCNNDILEKVVRHFPRLKELRVYNKELRDDVVETIASCCPNLESLMVKLWRT